MPRPIALLNVDRTLVLQDYPMNKPLFDALMTKEIFDIYLWTEIPINRETIGTYNAIVRMLEGMAEGMEMPVKIHGVLTPSDLAWSEPSGVDAKSADLGAEASALLRRLKEDEVPSLPKFKVSGDGKSDAASGAYTFLAEGAFGRAHRADEAAGFASLSAMVAGVRERVEARSLMGRLKQIMSVADSPFVGWRTIGRGYQPLEQMPGRAFEEASRECDERMLARAELSKMFAEHFASQRKLPIKALMLDLLLHYTAWISSMTVIDTPENVMTDFHPVSFDKDHALIPITWVAVDITKRVGQEGYLGPLQESLCKDHVMHICAELDVKILTAQKAAQAEDVAVFTSLKQAILADGADGVERDLEGIISMWVEANKIPARHLPFLKQLQEEYPKDSLTRVRSTGVFTEVLTGATADGCAAIMTAKAL